MRWKAFEFADAASERNALYRPPHQSASPTASPPGEAIQRLAALDVGSGTAGRSHDSADRLPIPTRYR